MNKDGYADITKVQGKQIALVHRIIDEGLKPHRMVDGWRVWEFDNESEKEPIRIVEKPERQFPRRYKK